MNYPFYIPLYFAYTPFIISRVSLARILRQSLLMTLKHTPSFRFKGLGPLFTTLGRKVGFFKLGRVHNHDLWGHGRVPTKTHKNFILARDTHGLCAWESQPCVLV